jgi:hypothetical protein
MGNEKLLADVAGIFAELGVSYNRAEIIADELVLEGILDDDEVEAWINQASNAPKQGECGC